jgi:hypothetical protein
MTQLTLFQIGDDECKEDSIRPPKAKEMNWMEVTPYDKAKEIYREKFGHYPQGFTFLDYLKHHPEEEERMHLRKMRRSR